MVQETKRTPLWNRHREEGAKLVPFAGWEMPIQYPRGPIEEHRRVRAGAGVFDISHMGRFEVSGAGAATALDRLVSSDTLGLTPGSSTYGLLCREDGGILDDLFVYCVEPGRYLVAVNAANREKDFAWFETHLGGNADTNLSDISDGVAMLAVQGPDAIPILNRISDQPLDRITRFGAAEREIAGTRCLVGRTGYTGEDGVELFPPAGKVVELWDAVRAAGIEPVGLAARDSLRFEPGFSLYGHELSEQLSPVEAGLTWACFFDRPFIGRDAILERKSTGPRERLVTFALTERGVPREGCEVFAPDEDQRRIGRVVTGMYAPSVDLYAGNAYLEKGYTEPGTRILIEIRGRKKSAEVRKRPLFRPRY